MKTSHTQLSSTSVLSHHILVIEMKGNQQIIYLSQDNYSIGRKADNDIVIKSDKVSRHHATIIRRMDKKQGSYTYWIVDGDLAGNKSHNGIFINRKRQFVHNLNSGDVIHLSPEIKASYHTVYYCNETKSYPSRNTFSSSSEQMIHEKTLIMVDPLSNKLQEENASYKDTLNQLSNHQRFIDYLNLSLDNAKRQEYLVGLGLLEIDNFISMSNSLKERLKSIIYKKLKSILRQGDFIYNWKDGQFMILLSHLKTADNLIRLASRILRIFETPISLGEKTTSLQINANLGLSVYPYDGMTSFILIENTKLALEKVKKNDSLAVGFYNEKLKRKNQFINRLDTLIKEAFTHQEFTLYYQPQINLHTKKVEAVEALLRWQHPSLGTIFPKQFLSLAEKGNNIMNLGYWVLNETCQQIQQWQSKNMQIAPISLNFSAQQFYHAQFVKMIKQALIKYQINPNLLGIEITENTLMENIEEASKIIEQLDDLGVSCTIDDFQGDKMALTHLKKLPIKTIKIAYPLVDKLKQDPQDTGIIAGIIALENHFGLTVLAKGVETQRQFNILRHLQCHQIQGNLYSPPLSASDMARYLTNFSEDTHLLAPMTLNNWQKCNNTFVQDDSVTLLQASAS